MRDHVTRSLALAAALLLVAAPAARAQSWDLVWSDEFNGTSVNTANWSFEVGGGGWGNNELQYYTSGANATVSGGLLTITARREGGFSCWYGACQYTSTRMITRGKREFTYGRIEARLSLPMGQGLWPAFWALGANIGSVGWPASGEIDVMEHINRETLTHGTIHWDAGGHASYGGSRSVPDPTAFHVYAIEWTPASIKWFVDGVQYVEANILNSINSTEEFHRPFFLLLNLAVGGNWPGSTTSASTGKAPAAARSRPPPGTPCRTSTARCAPTRPTGRWPTGPPSSSGPARTASTSSGASVPRTAGTTTSSPARWRTCPGT
jgi:beta-glucanase (GH16 family)